MALLHFRMHPPMVRVRGMVKLSAVFFHDESSITIGAGEGWGYESAIAPILAIYPLNLLGKLFPFFSRVFDFFSMILKP